MIDLKVQISVKKRDGRIVAFDQSKITRAITKAAKAVNGELAPADYTLIEQIADDAVATITERFKSDVRIPEVQSIVEQALFDAHQYDWGEAYTKYRVQRDIERSKKADVNYNVQKLLDRDSTV
ncbi:MAG: ATP cone domain-containing protein, partial [Lactobacillus sp.]|nr:ATP cone domain-containing protein [Lactobacillus sp.]